MSQLLWKTDEQGRQIYHIEGLQKILADVFAKNWRETPLVHIGVAVNVGAANRFRKDYGEKHGVRVSLMNMIQKCVAHAARDYPLICGIFDGEDTTRVIVPKPDEIVVSGPVMIGDTAIPILIERASSKTLAEISGEMVAIVDDLRSRDLTRADAERAFGRLMTTPNIGISNVGMMGQVSFVTAVSVAPTLAVLYAAAIIQTPVVDETGAIVVAPVINFTMAFDHRALAGGPVAKYLSDFKDLMEHPERIPA